jgi:hypothetical protein
MMSACSGTTIFPPTRSGTYTAHRALCVTVIVSGMLSG